MDHADARVRLHQALDRLKELEPDDETMGEIATELIGIGLGALIDIAESFMLVTSGDYSIAVRQQ